MGELVRELDTRLVADGIALTNDEVVLLLTTAVRAAGARLSEEEQLTAPDTGNLPTATDVVHVCNWLLNVADLEPFELGFWRNFSGALRTNPYA